MAILKSRDTWKKVTDSNPDLVTVQIGPRTHQKLRREDAIARGLFVEAASAEEKAPPKKRRRKAQNKAIQPQVDKSKEVTDEK